MTIVLFCMAVAFVTVPRWLSPVTRRLNPQQSIRIFVAAFTIGAALVELSLILFALPALFATAGNDSLAARCNLLGDLAPGGLLLSWMTAVLAVALPSVAYRAWRRAGEEAETMRAETTLGEHRPYEGVDLVRLPTGALIAYSLDGPDAQIVLSEGLVALLAPEELELVVSHEIAHVRGRHGRILRFLAAVETSVPPIRWITASVRLAMERCADEVAIRRDPDRRAALLDALLKVSAAQLPASIAAFTHRSGVVERAQALLAPPPAPTLMQRFAANVALIGVGSCGVVVLIGWAFEAHMLLAMTGTCR